jgi:hypothetical protein
MMFPSNKRTRHLWQGLGEEAPRHTAQGHAPKCTNTKTSEANHTTLCQVQQIFPTNNNSPASQSSNRLHVAHEASLQNMTRRDVPKQQAHKAPVARAWRGGAQAHGARSRTQVHPHQDIRNQPHHIVHKARHDVPKQHAHKAHATRAW